MPTPVIAFDVTPLQNAHRFRGIGAYVRALASRLNAQSQVPVEFWAWSGEVELIPSPPHRVLHVPRLPTPQYRGSWAAAQLAMRWRAMRSAAGVVHITDPDALVELPGRQLLATVYDLIPLKEGVDKRGPLARLGYKRYLRALPAANMLFAISQQTADDLVQELHVSKERIVIARPGIDIAPASESVAAPDRAYFVFVGGPNPNKNLEVVLEAMKLCPDLPEELLIIGHWLPRQLSALAGRLESDGLTQRVRHLGYVPDADLTRLMRDSTAVVVPSLMEGFGLAVGEGMAAGAAIIHSRLAVLEETSGGTALTFDPQSPAELANRLRTVSRDPTVRDHSRRLGLLRASELTWDSAVENTLATYRAFLRR